MAKVENKEVTTSEEESVLLRKLVEIEERIDLVHSDIRELNTVLDMLIRFSVTARAFMELAISEGLVDPSELSALASRYERSYEENLERGNDSVSLKSVDIFSRI